MNGYILIHRKLAEWQWYQDSSTLHLFIDLLLDANYDDSMVGLQEVKRGQCLTSLKRMSQRTGLSYRQIRTSLDKLQKSGEIDKQTTNRYSIITINKYNEYQDIDKQKTNKRQTKDNIKEINKEKEINNIKEKINKKEKYGSFQNIKLTDDEYQKLKDKFSDYEDRIERLSYYIASKGDKYKSHYATILNWSRKDNKDSDLPKWFDKEIKQGKSKNNELEKILEGF